MGWSRLLYPRNRQSGTFFSPLPQERTQRNRLPPFLSGPAPHKPTETTKKVSS